MPGKLSPLSLLATLSATVLCCFCCFFFYSLACLAMATTMFPLLFTVPFLLLSNSLPFGPCKVILQVKTGHLEACGLAVARCVVSP